MRRHAPLFALLLAPWFGACATKQEAGASATPTVSGAPAKESGAAPAAAPVAPNVKSGEPREPGEQGEPRALPQPPAPSEPAAAAASGGTAIDGTLRLLDRLDAWTIQSPWDPLAQEPPELGVAPCFALDFEGAPSKALHAELLATPFPRTPPLRPGTLLPPEPAPRIESGALRFEHASGFSFAIVPLHPDTPYVFSARVRRSVEPAGFAAGADEAARARNGAELARHGGVGSIVLLELNQLPTGETSLAELLESFAQKRNSLVTTHVLAPLDLPRDEAADSWRAPRMEWKSSVFSNALVIGLVAGNPGWWRLEASRREENAPPPGSVDFDDVALFELPLARWLATSSAVAHDDLPCDAPRAPPVPVAPRERAFVRKIHLLADARRALLAPPGTRASAPLVLPRGRFRLSFAYGVLEERRPGSGAEPVEFAATLERDGKSTELVRQKLRAAASAEASAWQEFALELDGDGGSARLAFATTGDAARGEMAAFAEPKIEPLRPARELPPNVLLVSIDTLRADRLGCQGYERADGEETTPNLDAFARDGLRFANARSVAPFTLPAHATMFTGLSPRVHRVTRDGRRLTSGVHPLLVEEFAAAGYATGAFTGGAFVAYEHGFHHGFDRYSILDPFLTAEDPYRDAFPRPAERAWNDAAYAHDDRRAIERWIDGQSGRPFFLFVHTYVAHNYHPPAAIERRFVRGDPGAVLGATRDLKWLDVTVASAGGRIAPEVARVASDVYDAAVAAADAEVGALLAFLRGRGLLDRTVVAIVSDHGEELGEHGGLLHGRTLHEELLRVPFLLRVPGIAPAVIDEPVDLADLAPTLREAAGLAAQPRCDGVSVLARLRGEGFAESFWAEVTAPGLSRRYALLAGRFKLIESPSTIFEEPEYAVRRPGELELFDLRVDPTERSNVARSGGAATLAGLQREMARRRAALDERRAALLPDARALEYVSSVDSQRLLHAIGYVATPEAAGANDEDE